VPSQATGRASDQCGFPTQIEVVVIHMNLEPLSLKHLPMIVFHALVGVYTEQELDAGTLL